MLRQMIGMELSCLLGVFLLLLSSQDVSSDNVSSSSSDEHSYIAAVVEYHPDECLSDDKAIIVLSGNVVQYENFITNGKQRGADIIVFPEYGLTGTLPSVNRHLLTRLAQTVPSVPISGEAANVPCLSPNASMVVKSISCSARTNQIYVAVNLPEVVPCSQDDKDCPDDGVYIYNTNVVFSRDGAVVSKYHKYNPFLEPAINKPAKPMYSTFSTDFGVTFGMFICFDILYREPALNLATVKNIKDFIYPTAWISELPFLTATQTQEGWAYGLNVNLLASGYNKPQVGHGGSGIYSGTKGALVSYMPSYTGSELLIARVPIISQEQVQRENSFLTSFRTSPSSPGQNDVRVQDMHVTHEDLSKYTYSDILQNGPNNANLCHGDFCCQFHADVQQTTQNYRFVIYDGIRLFGSRRYEAGVQVCALLYCSGDNFMSCSNPPKDPVSLDTVIFNSINISGRFTSSQFVFPDTLDLELKPLISTSFNFTKSNYETTIYSEDFLSGILTFSIFGRNFELDNNL